MPKRVFLFLLLIVFVPTVAFADSVVTEHGYLHEVDGQRVMHLWGNHYEMGYAHGQLLGQEIVALMHGYILHLLPPRLYELVDMLAPLVFTVPEEYREELRGMVDGIKASGADPFIEELGREIDESDLLLCNAVGDMGAMACSCQIAWDGATDNDPKLNGETTVVRNLDWALFGPDRFQLPKSTLVIVYSPDDPQQQTVASVAFPGFFGCLSCMDENGTTAVVDIAHNGIPLWEINWLIDYIPIGITIREAMHVGDMNQDQSADMYDIYDHIADNLPSGAVVINVAQPRQDSDDLPAMVIETDSAGILARLPEDDTSLPENVLIATNDLRKLRTFHECDRYDSMREEIAFLNGQLTLDAMWRIEQTVIQETFISTTAQTMYFLPFALEMGVSFSTEEIISANREPAVLAWNDLTELPPDDDVVDDDEIDDDQSDDDITDDDDSSNPVDDDDDDDACGC